MARLDLKAFFVGVAFEDALHHSIFRDIAKSMAQNPTFHVSFFFLGVIGGTLSFFAIICLTLNSLVIGWMIL